MTAVVVAMLMIVIIATGVVGVVGGQHHVAHSPDMQARMRRWQFVGLSRLNSARNRGALFLRAMRRAVADWLAGRPAAGNGPESARVRRLLPR